ncbi:acyltransferase [Brevibacillus laterosporus]|uniref:Acyltransferase n=3 Tax=Brevibacillus laterosporus TaxID=1465 RepID=A0AAP8QBX1_BRELA|nr:acyltransferase [Brevibacillus laterosporus]MCR8936869.1 acyltransferase [Brevibacillus laterosporus]MCZ0839507.1 acyltransferase [Brevibacillus laterosporus]MCZ0847632.1 acyltransferase [Brevibacillus laterosporus]MED1913649.1 acyltransferase [Brevibacillus laterosporus]PPA84110.1 acyltransferase [Brevibacillus laterosporus]
MNGEQNRPMKRYIPGLDGLRAMSVLAVIGYHLDLKWAQGGLLGVGIFFVLSGYLITDQIILEYKTKNKISILNFWNRRIRRLFPSMVCMLLLVALWLIMTDFPRLQALEGDFLSSLFYMNNWYLIFHEVSYFESFGPASPIGHLWSLSIEEQFYLVWPVVLLIGMKLVPRRGKIMLFILILASISAIAMAVMYEPGMDPSRVYYGTDTRAFAILIGTALAFVWPSWKLSDRISPSARALLDINGVLGILILLILIGRSNEYDDWLYQFGFLYVSFVTAAVIAVLAHPASRLGKIMACQPLTWIGKRSYSLYVWHYPVIVLSSPTVNTGGLGFTQILLQVTMSVILSALSYKYVEEPIRRGNFRAHLNLVRKRNMGKSLSGIALMILLYIFVTWSMNTTKPEPDSDVPVITQETIQSDDSSDGGG